MGPVLAQVAVGSTTEVVLFVVFAGIAIGAGIAMVSMRNKVHAALMLVINLLALAGLYLVLQSPFLSIIQVIVYAGAIMVLFLFVIMLLGIDRDDLLVDVRTSHRVLAVVAAAAVVAFLGWGIVGPYTGEASLCPQGDEAATQATVRTATEQSCAGMDAALAQTDNGSAELIAGDLFTRWTFPFEASALLLVVATIGAMLLGRREDTDPDDDPAWVPSVDLPELDPSDEAWDPPDDAAPADPTAADDAPAEADPEPVGAGVEAAEPRNEGDA